MAGTGDDGLETLVEGTAWEQDTPAAALADQPDIQPQTHDFPFEAAAGMFLSQANDIA